MCNNKCCMCCNCNIDTNNEDTPQEITYTSVCDSDACKNKQCCKCCCCEKHGLCEDDPSLMVMGLSEKMEECCDEVHAALEHIECEIEDINEKNAEQDETLDNHEDRITTLEYNESRDFNRVVYVTRDESQDHKAYIEFYHNENYMGRISAEPFLKDGILDSVDLESDGHTLHFVWNTDAGKQDSHVDLDRLVQPIAQELSEYKTYVSNTYETQSAAGNHINNVEYDQNDHHTLIFTKQNGQTITRTIPDADLYIQSGEYTGGNLVLTRNNNTTVTIPVPATNHIVGGSIDGRVITLTRENNGTPVTIQLPADANTYPVSGVVNGNTLTITNSDNSTVPITLPSWSTTDNDHYPTQATLSGNTLTISGNSGFNSFSVDLSGISGTTNVTYGGNTVTIQQAITAIENRLNALEGLWEINPSDSTQLVAKNSRSAKAAGFYDSTVNTVL